jgi:serine protease AprX
VGSQRKAKRALPRWLRTGAVGALAATLSVALSGATAIGSAPVGGAESKLWMSTAASTTSTTLRDVRTVINAASGSAGTLTGSGVGIALIDTGVAPVPGLPPAQLVNGPDLSFESQASSLRYLDTYGHGTHMAGIMVADDTATGTVGLAPKAKVTSLKLGTSDGSADVSQMIAAIDWVVANKNHDPAYPIRVLNLSYASGGAPNYASDPLGFAVEQAWRAGIAVVVAAGNAGNSSALLSDPATDPYVIAVGASTTKGTIATADDELGSFTNLSTSSRTVDLLAPGDGIVSLRDQGSNIDQTYPAARVGDTLFRGSGTSQAAAIVSSAVALLLQSRPTLTPDQVKKLLQDSATPILVGTGATKGLKQLNVGAALARTAATTTQNWTKSTGTGSIDAARGANHLVRDNVSLAGDNSIFGPFASATWAGRSAAKTAWSGGVWMGNRMAGDSWTGAGGSVATGQISGWAGKCVDMEGGNNANGVLIQLYPCNNTLAQYWSLQADGTIQALNKCLDVRNAGTANGTAVQIYDCNGTGAQKWRMTADRELVSTLSNRCLDASSSATTSTSGTPLQIRDCAKTEIQRWMPPFASKTWGAATWTARAWSGATTWIDPNWAGHYWAGNYWSGNYWSGNYWSGNDWSTAHWG